MTWLRQQWDRAGAWIAILVGAVALLLGYIGVSGTSYPAEQMPYIVSGGLVGIFLLGVGGMLWLSADLRDEWRKLDRIDEALRENGLSPTAEPATTVAASNGHAAVAETFGAEPSGSEPEHDEKPPSRRASKQSAAKRTASARSRT